MNEKISDPFKVGARIYILGGTNSSVAKYRVPPVSSHVISTGTGTFSKISFTTCCRDFLIEASIVKISR